MNFGSNINEVIRAVLNFLVYFYLFLQKDFATQKAPKEQKSTKKHKKHKNHKKYKKHKSTKKTQPNKSTTRK